MKGAVLLLLIAGVAFPSVVGYHIEPVKAAWSGKADPNPLTGGVSQTVVACWDSLERIELFAGAKGNGGEYRAGVVLDGDEVMHSFGTQAQNESWVRFQNWNTQVAFTKGKTYEVRFTRGGSDSIEYYYQSGDPYRYGLLMDPNLNPAPIAWDLACRVAGRMDTIGRT